jgi:hypothetical protein
MWMNYDYNPVLRDAAMLGGTTAPETEVSSEPVKPTEKTQHSQRTTDGFIQRKRLKILEAIYHRDKYAAVKSYIGTDANVISIIPLNYIIDNYIIIDVVYTSLLFDPTKLYYIKRDSLKLIDVNQKNKFITEVNGIPVAVTVLERYKNLETLPIYIRKTLDKSNEGLYSYYGLIQQLPTNEYCSIISLPEHIADVQLSVPNKLVDELSPNKRPKYSEEEQMAQYKAVVTKLSYNDSIDDVVHAKSINDIENRPNRGYIIDVNELKSNIHGIVYCIQKRNIFDVLIIPSNNHIITEASLATLKAFMFKEYGEYKTFFDN